MNKEYDLKYSSLLIDINFPPPNVDLLYEYPDCRIESSTIDAIVSYNMGISEDNLLLTCGAAEGMELVARLFYDAVHVVASPTIYLIPEAISRFSKYKIIYFEYKRVEEIRSKIYELKKKYGNICLWFVCPNNPTGECLSNNLVGGLDGINNLTIVIDEAYYELSGITYKAFIGNRGSIVILRSFSKGFGLSGARIGYIISDKRTISQIRRLREPFRVSGVSMHYAISAIEMLREYREIWHDVVRLRQRVSDFFDENSIDVVASTANFITVKMLTERSAKTLQSVCERKGIYLLGGWDKEFIGASNDIIRIAIRKVFDFELFVKAFLPCYMSSIAGDTK